MPVVQVSFPGIRQQTFEVNGAIVLDRNKKKHRVEFKRDNGDKGPLLLPGRGAPKSFDTDDEVDAHNLTELQRLAEFGKLPQMKVVDAAAAANEKAQALKRRLEMQNKLAAMSQEEILALARKAGIYTEGMLYGDALELLTEMDADKVSRAMNDKSAEARVLLEDCEAQGIVAKNATGYAVTFKARGLSESMPAGTNFGKTMDIAVLELANNPAKLSDLRSIYEAVVLKMEQANQLTEDMAAGKINTKEVEEPSNIATAKDLTEAEVQSAIDAAFEAEIIRAVDADGIKVVKFGAVELGRTKQEVYDFLHSNRNALKKIIKATNDKNASKGA